jgi:hypothetical protein
VGCASCGMRWEICLFILVELMMSVVGSASCWMRWEICLFILVELMMAVGGSRLSVVGCGFCFVLGAVGNLFVYTR